MTPKAPSTSPFDPAKFDPADLDSVIALVIAILGKENLARGPSEFAEAINSSSATIYRKLADGSLRAKLLDSKPLIPFWEQVRFIASLPDWTPLSQRPQKKRDGNAVAAKPELS